MQYLLPLLACSRNTQQTAMAAPPFLQNSSPQYFAILGLAVVGLLHVLGCLSRFLSWFWAYFLRPAKNLPRYGSWALVTGCTDGIGRGFSFQLAKRRLNLILVGRTQAKLEDLASELKKKYGILVKCVVLDFTDPDLDSGLSRVEEVVSGVDVGILVNSAGMSYPYARYFHELSDELTRDLIRVNVEVITRMVQIVLPGMLKRKKGAIVNIGSGAASTLPSDPLYALYAGTKGFMDKFSRTLYVEYKHSGIDVQCQVPLYVATKLASIRRPSFFCPSPDAYSRSAVKFIGYEPICTPYWPHSVLRWLAVSLPEHLVDSFRFQSSLDIRRRGQLKDSRKKE